MSPPARPSASPGGGGDAEVPLEDRDVPLAHQGLHEALYGGSAADVHGAGTAGGGGSTARFEDAGGTTFTVDAFAARVGSEKVAGVYRVLRADGGVEYVGVSRDVLLSLHAHRRVHGPAAVATVQVKTFRFPRRAALEDARAAWIAESPAPPPGNANPAWGAVRPADREDAMAPAARAAFEDTKLKLRKAMADPTLAPPAPGAARSPDDLRHAVEDDDWSAEINRQSAEAAGAAGAAGAAAGGGGAAASAAAAAEVAPPPAIVSPFAGGAAPAPAPRAAEPRELTAAGVDAVLDDVRPYLLADGGNVAVVGVDAGSGDVVLRLEGACGTCPSAAMTMQMGIERALRGAFGDRLGAVSAVSGADAAQRAPLSPALVDAVLDAEVRPAIAGLGGSVAVVSAQGAEVVLRYAGPDKLAYGIELILREKAPKVQTVVFEK